MHIYLGGSPTENSQDLPVSQYENWDCYPIPLLISVYTYLIVFFKPFYNFFQ